MSRLIERLYVLLLQCGSTFLVYREPEGQDAYLIGFRVPHTLWLNQSARYTFLDPWLLRLSNTVWLSPG